MKAITIRIAAEGEPYAGSFMVDQDGKTAVALGWDEMLGQIAAMTIGHARHRIESYGGESGGIYRMQSPEEIAASEARYREHKPAEAV